MRGCTQQVWIFPGQVMRDGALRLVRRRDFIRWYARVPVNLRGEIQNVISRADERLGEIYRVADENHEGNVVSVSNPMLTQRAKIASEKPHALVWRGLQVSRSDRQLIAFPFSRGESLPGMRRVLGRVRPAIHPDDSFLSLPFGVLMPCDHLLRDRIDFLPDTNGADIGKIIRRQRVALLLGQRINGGV